MNKYGALVEMIVIGENLRKLEKQPVVRLLCPPHLPYRLTQHPELRGESPSSNRLSNDIASSGVRTTDSSRVNEQIYADVENHVPELIKPDNMVNRGCRGTAATESA